MTRCVRPDGSSYPSSGSCRKGKEEAAPEWFKKWEGRSTGLDSSLNSLLSRYSQLPEEEKELWSRRIKEDFDNPKLKSKHGVPYTDERIDKMMSSHCKAWVQMMGDGPPSTLVRFGDQSEFEAPKGMIPRVVGGSSGQKTWINPQNGLIYNHKPGGKATQARASNEDKNRRIKDFVNFKKYREKSREPWPTQSLDPIGEKKDFDKVWKSLTEKEVSAIALNGLDPTGFDFRSRLAQWYNSNPEIREARAKDIVRRWVDQDGRSGVTGQPVAIPGLKPKNGEERSSTDHFNPLSGANSGMSNEEIREKFDNYNNYMIAEPAFNQGRGNRSWESYAKGLESQEFTETGRWVQLLKDTFESR